MALKCSKCGSQKYKVIGYSLLKDGYGGYRKYLIQRNKCVKCGVIARHKLPLVVEKNDYRYIQVGHGRGAKVNQLHRFVKELEIGRQLRSNERVKFFDGHKGNCRLDNLQIVKVKKTNRFIK